MANTSGYGPGQRSTEQGMPGQSSRQQRTTEASTAGSVAHTVAEKAKEVASETMEAVEQWGSAAAEAAEQAKQKAQQFATTAVHKAESFGDDLTAMIRRYPMQALLLGLGAGFLLAQMKRR